MSLLQVEEVEIPPAAQTDLETELENEKVSALPKTLRHTSDNAFWEEEITGVDLGNAMDFGAEIEPIEETSLEEIKQSDNLTNVDENTSDLPVVIEEDERETPDADAGPLNTGDHNGETLKPELKIDVPFQEEELVEKTLTQTVESHVQIAEMNTFAVSEPNQQGGFVDQNYASALIIEKLAQNLNKHYWNNDIQNEEQGESREFAFKEEVFEKEVIEEKPDEATTSIPIGPAIEIFAVSPVPAEGQHFMAVVLVDNGNIPLGPEVLGSLPFPVTVAVPGQTDVHRVLMQYYRDAGYAGVMSITGSPDTQPYRVGYPIADTSGGIAAAMSICAALNANPRGAFLDISIMDAVISSMGWVVSNYVIGGLEPTANGNENMTPAPSGTFMTSDKPINIAANRDAQWVSLATHIDRQDLLEHADYKTREQRKKNRTALRLEIEKVLLKRPAKKWVQEFNAIGVPADPVLTVPEVLANAQVKERELIATVEVEGEVINVVTGPVKIDGTKPMPTSYLPELGQHNYEIWGKLGLSHAEIDDLKKEGVI